MIQKKIIQSKTPQNKIKPNSPGSASSHKSSLNASHQALQQTSLNISALTLSPELLHSLVKTKSFFSSFPASEEADMYQALVLGTRDYVYKNGFKQVVLGLSGGIDSALVLTIAVDALGESDVHPIIMPSRFTRKMSIQDAKEQCGLLKVPISILSIEPFFELFLNELHTFFLEQEFSLTNIFPKPTALKAITKENLQARLRAVLLMAASNETNSLVLNASNKSEFAVGYTTLYGDMIGAFCVLKDVLKTDVYRLAHFRNTLSPVIPKRILTRAPSA